MTDLFLNPNVINTLAVALGVTLFGCIFTILTSDLHGKYTLDSATGVQRAHTQPTPRVGGIPIMFGLLCVAPHTDEATRYLLYPTVFACIPAFAFGLAEDLTKRVSPLKRLFATMSSGVLGWMISGVSLTSVGLNWIDQLLAVSAISVVFTSFAVGGIANSVNLIDGFNGIASGFVIIALLALASISTSNGDTALAKTAMVIAATYAGFFLVNWPLGRIFLGDGGAYSGGFLVAWLCILLTVRNEAVSPFAALLICAHPVTETIHTIVRRLRKGTPIGQPDSMHLHNIICDILVSNQNWKLRTANPLTGILITLLSIPFVLLASMFYKNGAICAALFLAFMFFYSALHKYLLRWLIKKKY